MRVLAIPLIMLGYVLTTASCESSYSQRLANSLMTAGNVDNSDTSASSSSLDNNIEKRAERYAFGLGRRAYTYTSGGSGVKRLPVYNFGLGKRARPYGFGLGKRADDEEYGESDGPSYDGWAMPGQMSEKSHDNMELSEKRARPYSFGLGKRLQMIEDASVERRGSPQRYNFGLGSGNDVVTVLPAAPCSDSLLKLSIFPDSSLHARSDMVLQ